MSDENISVGARYIPAMNITQDNVAEAVRLLYSVLGAGKLGVERGESGTYIWICGEKIKV